MRSGNTAKVLAQCKLKYYRVSECPASFSFPVQSVSPLGPAPVHAHHEKGPEPVDASPFSRFDPLT